MSSTNHITPQSKGSVAPRFEQVRIQFDAYLEADVRYSAQVAIYHRGDLVVDLVGGPDMTADSLTGVYSCTKGAGAVALATLVEDGSLDLTERVAHYWPEFAAHGKGTVTVAQLLSHQAGLVNVRGGMPYEELVLDSRLGAERLAAERPLWKPGTAFGYHGITIGVFMEELVRRITGSTLQKIFEERLRAPRDIDFYLGLPESQEFRYRDVLPAYKKPDTPQQTESVTAVPPDGYAHLMMNALRAYPDVTSFSMSVNHRRVRAHGASGVAGVGSARGLAAVYAAALGHVGEPLLSPETVEIVSQQQSWGRDRVLGKEMAFASVFMTAHGGMDFGSYRAFGHDGAGGAIGCADPTYDLAFGYVPAALQPRGGADPKGLQLNQIARLCLLN